MHHSLNKNTEPQKLFITVYYVSFYFNLREIVIINVILILIIIINISKIMNYIKLVYCVAKILMLCVPNIFVF